MSFHFSDVLSLVRSHPFVSCFVLLFFTPPLFPVVIYFSPLIVSTALCVLALVSISAHFGASAGEGGAADGIEASPTEEKIMRKVRLSEHEVPWMEWIKGCDDSLLHFVEKQSPEDHELRHLSVKEEWSTSWETNKADRGELANHTLGEEEDRAVDKRTNSASSLKEDLAHAKRKEEDVGEEELDAKSSLRFSFFQKEDNSISLTCPAESDPNSDGHSWTANVEEKNARSNPEVSPKHCNLKNAGPVSVDERPLTLTPKDIQTRSENPEE